MSRDVDRRTFLRGAATGSAVALASGLVGPGPHLDAGVAVGGPADRLRVDGEHLGVPAHHDRVVGEGRQVGRVPGGDPEDHADGRHPVGRQPAGYERVNRITSESRNLNGNVDMATSGLG